MMVSIPVVQLKSNKMNDVNLGLQICCFYVVISYQMKNSMWYAVFEQIFDIYNMI